MEIDFHFGVTYVVSRLAGLNHEDAEVVATSSQYVDDTINHGVLNFSDGSSYYRISTAHDKFDYHILLPVEERRTWIPFHFLPGNDSVGSHKLDFYNRIVCRPNSPVAQAMLKNCIEKKNRPFTLHQLGITAHVFIDTWAHQGFAGVNHPINSVKDIQLLEPKDKKTFYKTLKCAGIKAALWQEIQPTISALLDNFFPMGHGAALHYPDHPFRYWSYKNGHEDIITRNNPLDFLEAADELHQFITRYIQGDSKAPGSSLSDSDRTLIAKKIAEYTDEDGHVRNEKWLASIKRGEFSFGKADPIYVSAGPGSWKAEALGVNEAKTKSSQQFQLNPDFMTAHWKLFHDAAKAHQFEILSEILPSFGISAI